MNFARLITNDKVVIDFGGKPFNELKMDDEISFDFWPNSIVVNPIKISDTYYIIECRDCKIYVELYKENVYVIVMNINDDNELRRSKFDPTDIEYQYLDPHKYPNGIADEFE